MLSYKLRALTGYIVEKPSEAFLTMRKRTSMTGWTQTAEFVPAKEANFVIQPIIKTDFSDLRKELQQLIDLLTELQEKPLIYTATLHDLENKKHKLKKPIEVIIERHEDEFVVRFPELEIFGSAETEAEAIRELKKEIITLHVELAGSKEAELGPLPQMWRRILRKLIYQ